MAYGPNFPDLFRRRRRRLRGAKPGDIRRAVSDALQKNVNRR
jgi:hypothetical protein